MKRRPHLRALDALEAGSFEIAAGGVPVASGDALEVVAGFVADRQERLVTSSVRVLPAGKEIKFAQPCRRAIVVAQDTAKSFPPRDRGSETAFSLAGAAIAVSSGCRGLGGCVRDGSDRRTPRSRREGGAHQVVRACRGTQI